MIYTIIISLLIEKPFYLLRQQSFSFQIVSEFIDTFVKFSNFMFRGWGFWLPVLSRGEGFCTQWLSLGEGFAPFKSCPGGYPWGGGGGIVLDSFQSLFYFKFMCATPEVCKDTSMPSVVHKYNIILQFMILSVKAQFTHAGGFCIPFL